MEFGIAKLRRNMKKGFKLLVASMVLFVSLAVTKIGVNAASTTVTADACKVRKEASTSSDVISSVTHGQKLEVLGATTADDGYTWYQVKDGDNKGYIRADLVDTPDGAIGTVSASSDTQKTETKKEEPKAESSESSGGSNTGSTPVGASDVATAVTTDKVSVRSGASTQTSKVASANSGQEVAVSGEAMDADGYTWYQISYLDGNKGVEGFIRSDFLEVLERYEEISEEPAEEEYVEEIEAPVVPQDYEVVYEANSEGVEEWFLYDHIRGTKQSIENIHAVMQQSQEYADIDNDQAGKYKIGVFVLAAIAVILLIVVAILAFKLHDSYEDYEDIEDDDDEDEEEEEEEDIEDIDEEEEEDDYYEPKKRKFGLGARKKPTHRKSAYDFDDDEDDEEDDDYVRPARRGRRSEESFESDGWSTDGLLDIDDDMEFEFLGVDK